MNLASYFTNWICHIYDETVLDQPVVVYPFFVQWVVVHAHDRWFPPIDCSLLSVFVRDDELFLGA